VLAIDLGTLAAIDLRSFLFVAAQEKEGVFFEFSVVPRRTLERAIKRVEEDGDYTYVGLKEKSSGPSRKLSAEQATELRGLAVRELRNDSQIQLAAVAHEKYGVTISQQSVSRNLNQYAIDAGEAPCVLKQMEGFTADANLPRLIDMGLSWMPVLSSIDEDQIAWFDETGVKWGGGNHNRTVRGVRGKKAYGSIDANRSGKATVTIFVSKHKIHKVVVTNKNTSGSDTFVFLCCKQKRSKKYDKLNGDGIDAMAEGLIKEGVWAIGCDLLGKGNSNLGNATCSHFDARIREVCLANGIRVFHLPPKGCLFNPVEVIIGELKKFITKWRPSQHGRTNEFPSHGTCAFGAHEYTGPQSYQEVCTAVQDFLSLPEARLQKYLSRGYKERGQGRDFKKFMGESAGVYQEVATQRETIESGTPFTIKCDGRETECANSLQFLSQVSEGEKKDAIKYLKGKRDKAGHWKEDKEMPQPWFMEEQVMLKHEEGVEGSTKEKPAKKKKAKKCVHCATSEDGGRHDTKDCPLRVKLPNDPYETPPRPKALAVAKQQREGPVRANDWAVVNVEGGKQQLAQVTRRLHKKHGAIMVNLVEWEHENANRFRKGSTFSIPEDCLTSVVGDGGLGAHAHAITHVRGEKKNLVEVRCSPGWGGSVVMAKLGLHLQSSVSDSDSSSSGSGTDSDSSGSDSSGSDSSDSDSSDSDSSGSDSSDSDSSGSDSTGKHNGRSSSSRSTQQSSKQSKQSSKQSKQQPSRQSKQQPSRQSSRQSTKDAAVGTGAKGNISGNRGRKRGDNSSRDEESNSSVGDSSGLAPFGTSDSWGAIVVPADLARVFDDLFGKLLWRAVATLGDGQCLFRAVAKHLQMHPGVVRQSIVNFWSNDSAARTQLLRPRRAAGADISLQLEEWRNTDFRRKRTAVCERWAHIKEDIERYCDSDDWGGSMEANLLAVIHNVDIVVFDVSGYAGRGARTRTPVPWSSSHGTYIYTAGNVAVQPLYPNQGGLGCLERLLRSRHKPNTVYLLYSGIHFAPVLFGTPARPLCKQWECHECGHSNNEENIACGGDCETKCCASNCRQWECICSLNCILSQECPYCGGSPPKKSGGSSSSSSSGGGGTEGSDSSSSSDKKRTKACILQPRKRKPKNTVCDNQSQGSRKRRSTGKSKGDAPWCLRDSQWKTRTADSVNGIVAISPQLLLPLTQTETKPQRVSSVKKKLATDQKWRPQDGEGWPMNIHIAYDVQTGVLYLHDGTHRVAAASQLNIESVLVRRDIHMLHTPGFNESDIDEFRHKGKAISKAHADDIRAALEQKRKTGGQQVVYLDALDFEGMLANRVVSVAAQI
jgi:hypothetical protein